MGSEIKLGLLRESAGVDPIGVWLAVVAEVDGVAAGRASGSSSKSRASNDLEVALICLSTHSKEGCTTGVCLVECWTHGAVADECFSAWCWCGEGDGVAGASSFEHCFSFTVLVLVW